MPSLYKCISFRSSWDLSISKTFITVLVDTVSAKVTCEMSLIFNCYQALVVVQALSLASDEVHWLVRHKEHNPPKGKKNPDDYVDT